MTKRFEITEARFLAPEVKLIRITAPRIAKRQKPGQFVIIRVNETGERIPLTIADSDPQAGTVTIIVHRQNHPDAQSTQCRGHDCRRGRAARQTVRD